jgi:hypothetical protein
VVREQLDLVQQVRAQQDGPAVSGEVREQAAQPADAGRVEAVGRLVEDEDLRTADQGVREAEPLAHAERVVADPSVALGVRQADALEHLVDRAAGQAHQHRVQPERGATGASRVLGRGVEEHADLTARVVQPRVRPSEDRAGPGGRCGQPGQHPQRARLARTVGPEEAGDGAGFGRKETGVDDRRPP